MKKTMKILLSLAIMIVSFFSNSSVETYASQERAKQDTLTEYYVYEDAFARKNRATQNFNYDPISEAHDPAYANKDYKAMNAKRGGGDEIIPAMKFRLPSKADVEQYGWNKLEFVFHMLLNKNPDAGDQTYVFHYSQDTNWDETTLTWNTKPAYMNASDTNILFEFDVPQGDAYNGSTGDKNEVRADITDQLMPLIEEGVEEITIFVTAKNDVDTFILFHALETSDTTKLAHIQASNEVKQEYSVQEDAYLRDGSNADKNYDYENIVQAHGEQYVGKNYRVVNVKNNRGQIMSVMKFPLPTQAEIDANQFDTFEFVFHIFKNADYNNGDQVYRFLYSTDTSWSENAITWNNKPADIDRNSQNFLFDFAIAQGVEYESMSDAEKEIHIDITDQVQNWVNQGLQEITIFAYAQNDLNTSLMIHERSSSLEQTGQTGDKAMKIVASKTGINLEALQALIAECSQITGGDYTAESFAIFSEKLLAAKQAVAESADAATIKKVYEELLAAKEGLVSAIDPNDAQNVAYQKPTRSNLNKENTGKVNDGDANTYWNGKFFPSYVDIDLMDTYDIQEIILQFPKDKAIYYTVYGSNDGKDYDELYQNHSDNKKTEPDTIPLNDCAYRIVRVYLEYTDTDNASYLSEVKVHGTKTNTNTEELRTGNFQEITNIQDFANTEYATEITQEETIENVYGIIDRTVGSEYRDWFVFDIAPNTNNDNDYFTLSNTADGKILITGNEGLSLSTGLNYYYKNYVNVQISEQTMQAKMPETIVPISGTVRKETDMKVRYAFNYCTLSYTFAFFGEEEWQRENDWLALNGVNVVLDLAGQEATWIKFLMDCGYSYDDAKDWLVGPGYYAWQFMDNMEVFGGPIPDGYVIDRVELARKTQRWKNSLGMQTILQGYAGMVPTNFADFYPEEVSLIEQGSWNGFARPTMIATDSEAYDTLAQLFYASQKYIYGDTSDYYAVDPFHEGGKRPSGLTDDRIAAEVLESMLKNDANAVWVVQGWQDNPTSKLIEGMGDLREEHVFIVDLIKYPLQSTANYKESIPEQEFNHTNWVWGLLGNFGGNPTMNGQLEVMVNDIQTARQERQNMIGMGIISEATYDNPMIYDLIFDLVWADASFDLDQWMDGYIERRYGGITNNARMAWQLIKDANYQQGVRLTPELFGIRTGGKPSSVGKKSIGYEYKNLENALRLLLADYDKFKDSEGYRYDLSEIMRQVVSNYSVLKYHEVIDARDAKDLEAFQKAKTEFLHAFDVLNEVSATQQDQLAGEWIGKALDRAENYDDFSKSTFAMNAKSLITTWGSTSGALIDYGFRTYEGMFLDIRKSNWVEYLDQVEQNIIDGTKITDPNYSRKYWKWVVADQTYTREAKDTPEDIKTVAEKVLSDCVYSGELDVNIGNIALDRQVESTSDSEGNLAAITDGEVEETVVLSAVDKPELIIDLLGVFELSKIQVICDEATAYGYEIYISDDKQDWVKAGEKAIQDDTDTFTSFDQTSRYVKIVGVADDDDDDKQSLGLQEVRVYGDRALPTLEHLQRLIETADDLDLSGNEQDKIDQFQSALTKAKQAYEQQAALDTVNVVHWELYDAIVDLNISGVYNIALHKKTQAHNDPSGNSSNMVDGDFNTVWNSGRLSATGKPYEDTITEGYNIIDLDGLYEVSEIQINFKRNDIWHQYEIYASLDGEAWIKVGEKKTETLPNEKEDTYKDINQYARYLKLQTTNIEKGDENGTKRCGYEVSEFVAYGKEIRLDREHLQQLVETANKKIEAHYTEDSWAKLVDALHVAQTVLDKAEDALLPEEIEEAETLLSEAIQALIYKDADYSKVEEAIQLAESLHPEEYVDFSGVEKAIAAVVRGKNITQQAEVDAMADAILQAIDKLEKKSIVEPEQPDQEEGNNQGTGTYEEETKEGHTTANTADHTTVSGWIVIMLASGSMLVIWLKRKRFETTSK